MSYAWLLCLWTASESKVSTSKMKHAQICWTNTDSALSVSFFFQFHVNKTTSVHTGWVKQKKKSFPMQAVIIFMNILSTDLNSDLFSCQVVDILVLICASIDNWYSIGGGWVQFVAASAMITTIILFIFHFFNIMSRLSGPWNFIVSLKCGCYVCFQTVSFFMLV